MTRIDDVLGTTANIDGKWVIARPINYTCRTFIEKIKDALGVFTGKYEAMEFYKQ